MPDENHPANSGSDLANSRKAGQATAVTLPAVNETAVQSAPNEAATTLCSLNRVKAGMAVRVKRLIAAPETCQRLRELGLNEESIIRLIACQATLICQVQNARLAFSETLARGILVESLDASPCA